MLEKENAIAQLREMLKPGDTVQTILRHVSRSGMSRSISPVFNGQDITYLVQPATGIKFDCRHDGLKMGGCGMDMGFALVYELSHVLFPNGFECIGDRCPASEHANGDRDYSPHHHEHGAYALRHRWL